MHFLRALTSAMQARSEPGTGIPLRLRYRKLGRSDNDCASATMCRALLPDRFTQANFGQCVRHSHISCVSWILQKLRSSSSMFPFCNSARAILIAPDSRLLCPRRSTRHSLSCSIQNVMLRTGCCVAQQLRPLGRVDTRSA